ncbi:hypothetical protein SLH49_21735 [Cognatiyoonia sp. IB215446]|uniref:hypothetical protein n=1 Tax=Cognatiyoonia sp. IB215446 TaxID=3097355 RepID=UPI002A0E69D2|nr:hypothetical protein [Cognatiyoonia sp. IB215446]MDX8350620.1 hypothetical protein [Cognatiyoonia sp. IB215446]
MTDAAQNLGEKNHMPGKTSLFTVSFHVLVRGDGFLRVKCRKSAEWQRSVALHPQLQKGDSALQQ